MGPRTHQLGAGSTGVLLVVAPPCPAAPQRGPRRPPADDPADRLDRREALLHRLELDRHRRRGARQSRSA